MVTNHVYTVAGAKGGVGKTTTSINLGAALAQSGYSTVTVELDLAMANLVDFLEIDIDVTEATTLHDVLAGDADVEDAIYETDTGLSVVPSGTDLAGYAGTDLDRLPEVVETLRWHHDVVLLDTPAGLSEETMRPIQLADDVLLVSTPRVASIRNVRNTLELADRVDTEVRGLVLTKSGTGASPGADRIAEFLDVELLGHVPEDDAVPHSQDKGMPVISNAPKSGAAIAYRKISRQLVEHPPAPDATASTADPAEREEARDVDQTDGEAPDGQAAVSGEYGRAVTVGATESDPDEQSGQQRSPVDESAAAGPDSQSSDAERDDGVTPSGDEPSAGEAVADEPEPPRPTDTEEPARDEATADGGAPTAPSNEAAQTSESDDTGDQTSQSTPADGTTGDETTASESSHAEQSTSAETAAAGEKERAAESETTESDDKSLGAQIRSLFGF
ncbi:cell division ATPase MinD [Halomicroarcula sp. F13]|uniref:Cell division ATPase MinD n=1 Tax=Haloarcula rubra TaxID=2487747 RepID=A0AAW4PMV9_9EURY|nr:cell division ATPase MinD [Halomicroarcula rubra]MBX0321890.1 cell division ATPase MinD [Halomicroarcula rubra]